MRTSKLSLAIAVTALAVVAGGTTAVTTPAAATTSPPAPTSCPAVFPLSKVQAGMSATGWTTDHGRTPAPFKVTVLGVMDDAIAPGIPMVLVRTDSPAIRAVHGIWQGMSGSPVYAADGRLIGALSYGFSYGPSRAAGLTPAAQMYKLLSLPVPTAAATSTIALSRALQRAVTASGAATARTAASGMTLLTTPVFVSGAGPTSMTALRTAAAASAVPLSLYQGAAAPTTAAGTTSVRPGTPIAAALSYGAFTYAGVGTVTAVCNGVALAFGHPMQAFGATSESAHLASVYYVQDEPLGAPYVMARVGGLVGTVDQDRLVGIRARLGALPKAARISGTVYASTGYHLTLTTRVPVGDWVSTAAANTLYGGVFATLQKDTSGRGWVRWSSSGHRADGTWWTYDRTDRTSASYDLGWEMMNLLWDPLSRIGDNSVEKVTIDNVVFHATAEEGMNDQTVTGAGPATPAPVAPGGTLTVPVQVMPYRDAAGTHTIEISVPVPDTAAPGDATLTITGGRDIALGDPVTTSFDDVLAQLLAEPRNDNLVAQLTFADGTSTRVDTWIGEVVHGGPFMQTVTVAVPAPPTP